MRVLPDLGRLGLGLLVRDHLDTLYEIDRDKQRKKSYSDYFVFFGIPVAAFTATWLLGWKFKGIEELLAGVAILTGLLFGLLIHVFSLGLKVTESTLGPKPNRVMILVDELRSNVSYSCGIGLVLTVILMICAAFDVNTQGAHPLISGTIALLGLHLILTLFMVMKRVRSAYKLLVGV